MGVEVDPAVAAAGVIAAHKALTERLGALTDDVARRPSRLPGWSVGHVLTHIARNADSVVRRLDGAAQGRVVDQYPGGTEGRRQGIEEGAARRAVALVDDVLRTSGAVETALHAFPEEGWQRLTRSVDGSEQPAWAVVFSRWREVVVHHVDLGMGYEPREWPDDLVELWLPRARETFLDSADRRDLLAWLVGRGPAPRLDPWG